MEMLALQLGQFAEVMPLAGIKNQNQTSERRER
jgi:hypothetical protein